MNYKYTMTSLMMVLIALSAVSASQYNAFAEGVGMSITASAEPGSSQILINGQTMSQRGDITLKVTSPSGTNLVDVKQVSPDMNGNFGGVFMIGNLWNEDGFYSITARQGQSSLYNLTVFVNVTGGMAQETMTTESNLETGLLGMPSQEPAMSMGLSIEAEAIVGSTIIGITGMTDKMMDVTLVVSAPNGNVVDAGQVQPNLDGTFAMDINVGGPLWNQDGDYVVTAQQGTNPAYKDSVIVEIKDGVIVPEFGTIAAMILAVAIISIIAISARSRLSIMPR